MKNIILTLSFISFVFCFAQKSEKETVYLFFNTSSNKTFLTEVNGEKIKEKFYSKGIKKNGEITFYIGKEMFSFQSKKNDTCTTESLKNIKISDIGDLKKDVNKINPLYPFKVFPNLYIVEKIDASTLVKYKVKWEYYIE